MKGKSFKVSTYKRISNKESFEILNVIVTYKGSQRVLKSLI